VRFSACNAGTKTAAPGLGEHTDSILKQLDYSGHDIEKLKRDKVVY